MKVVNRGRVVDRMVENGASGVDILGKERVNDDLDCR